MSHKSPAPRGGRLKPNPNFFSPRGADKEPTVSEAILKQARKTGNLNLSNKSLSVVPDRVWRLNIDPPEGSTSDFSSDDRWWDQVDLKRLNLSANEISELSEGIENFPALQSLDVQYNKLTSLPRAIGTLQNLSELLLSHNKLTSLPYEIQNLTNLKILRLDFNQLTELPETIIHLGSLETLSVSQNKLTCLPPDIGLLMRLKSLTVSDNSLPSLPESLGRMKGLKELVLNNNKLVTIPTLDGMNQLGELNIRQNQLKELPNLPNTPIKSLLLAFNRITEINEDRLHHLKSLTILELRENKITKLPDSIVELEKLERLDLTNNNLTSLPFVMGRMEHLQSFHLEGNSLRTLRREVINRGTAELLRYLLSRIETEIPVTPPTISSPSHSMKMKSGEQSSPSVRDRTVLNLSKSGLAVLTEEHLGDSQIWSTLNVSFNELKSLPDVVGTLTRLTVLELGNNLLTDLPQSLSSCTMLQDVFITNNRFTVLPEVLYNIPSLQNILAGDNQIGVINVEGLMKLKSLGCLDLHNNDIHQVPPQLGRIEWLRSLEISGNPFRSPRPTIVAKGTAELLQYLRDRIPT